MLPTRIDLGTLKPREDPAAQIQTKADIRQAENARNKRRQAQTLQKYHAAGDSIAQLSRRFNLDPRTVKRYLEMRGVPDTSRQKRPKALDAFHRQVFEREAAGDSIRVIYEKLQAAGYSGAYGSVKVFLAALRKKKRADIPLDTEYHSRRDIRRILWQNRLADDSDRDLINRVLKQYPSMHVHCRFL